MSDARFIASGDLARMAKIGKAPKNPLVRVGATPIIKAVNENARSVDFVISDASLDRDNDTINPAGWDLAAYLKNPVVLWAHDPSSPPVAKAPDTRVVGNQLISTAVFMPKDMGAIGLFADSIFQAYSQGFMNATSVGFRPLQYEMRSDEAGEWGCDFDTQELLEYSCVPVPANANALMRMRKAGIDTQPFVKWAEQVLEAGGRMWLPKVEMEALRKAAGAKTTSVHHMAPKSQDELIRRNRTLVALDVCHPGAKAGQAFVVGGDLETKWTRDSIGTWKSSAIDPAAEKILASGEVVAQTKEPNAMSDAKPVYVKRQVLNHKDVHKWMKSQGYTSAVKPEDMHVTVMHSKEAVDPEQLPHHDEGLNIPAHRAMPVEIGEHHAQVLPVESNDLNEQHQAFCDAGCVHTQDSFAPHVTLTYQRHPDHPDHNVEAYSGEIKLGAEIHEPVKDESDFEPPDEMDLDDTYGADPEDAGQGNAPKAAEILALAKKEGRSVTIKADGSITIHAKGDETPKPDWKCSAAKDLPIDEDSAWDGSAAQKSIFDACGFDGDKPDSAKAAKYFLAHDASNPTQKGSYKLPFARFEDGKPKAIARGIQAAEGRLNQTDIPEAVKTSAGTVLAHYKERMGKAISEADIRKIIAEEIAKSTTVAGLDGKITIKLADGSHIDTVEDFETYVAAYAEKQIRAHQGRID